MGGFSARPKSCPDTRPGETWSSAACEDRAVKRLGSNGISGQPVRIVPCASNEGDEAMATTADIPALMAHLAKALVDAPDEVEAEAFDEGNQIVVELVVAEEEVGKIIGRQGRMARSLRTIMNAAALKTRKRYQLEIVE